MESGQQDFEAKKQEMLAQVLSLIISSQERLKIDSQSLNEQLQNLRQDQQIIQAKEFMEKAELHFINKEYDQAEQFFRQSDQIYHYDCISEKIAECYFYTQQWQKAIDEVDKVLHLDPLNFNLYKIKGISYLQLKQYESAYYFLYNARCLSKGELEQSIQDEMDNCITYLDQNSEFVQNTWKDVEKKQNKKEGLIYKQKDYKIISQQQNHNLDYLPMFNCNSEYQHFHFFTYDFSKSEQSENHNFQSIAKLYLANDQKKSRRCQQKEALFYYGTFTIQGRVTYAQHDVIYSILGIFEEKQPGVIQLEAKKMRFQDFGVQDYYSEDFYYIKGINDLKESFSTAQHIVLFVFDFSGNPRKGSFQLNRKGT